MADSEGAAPACDFKAQVLIHVHWKHRQDGRGKHWASGVTLKLLTDQLAYSSHFCFCMLLLVLVYDPTLYHCVRRLWPKGFMCLNVTAPFFVIFLLFATPLASVIGTPSWHPRHHMLYHLEYHAILAWIGFRFLMLVPTFNIAVMREFNKMLHFNGFLYFFSTRNMHSPEKARLDLKNHWQH